MSRATRLGRVHIPRTQVVLKLNHQCPPPADKPQLGTVILLLEETVSEMRSINPRAHPVKPATLERWIAALESVCVEIGRTGCTEQSDDSQRG